MSEAEQEMVEAWGVVTEQSEQENETSLKKLALLIDRLEVQREQIAKVAEQKKLLTSVEEDIENQIKAILIQSGQKRFDGSGKSVSLVEKRSFKVPKTEEDKAKLREYCLENNLDYLLTVNSGSLNEWLNEEIRIAEEAGLDGVVIPGLEEPKVYYDLSVRTKKK